MMPLATCFATVLEKRRPLPADAMILDPIVGFGAIGHRMMDARHLRGLKRRSETARHEVKDEAWRKALLICGIVSSLLYGAMIGAIRFEGYSRISQVPSELTAIGAPTRWLWMLLGAVYTVLVTAFGWGRLEIGGAKSRRSYRRGLDVGLWVPWPPVAVCRDAPT